MNRQTDCHPDRKHFAKGLCKSCYSTINSRKWVSKNRERVNRTLFLWRQKNKLKLAAQGKARRLHRRDEFIARQRKWRKENPGKVQAFKRKYNLNANLKRFGISEAAYRLMLLGQNGGCAVCGNKPNKGRVLLCFDHDHTTGLFRGLICNQCNIILGGVNDNTDLLQKLIQYLESTIQQKAA